MEAVGARVAESGINLAKPAAGTSQGKLCGPCMPGNDYNDG